MRSDIKYFIKIILTVLISILAFNAIANMLFGSLGNTSESESWNYILTLYIFLAILGATIAFQDFKILNPFTNIVSGILSSALLGFYYGGSMTDNNSTVAIISGLLLVIVTIFLSIRKNPIIVGIFTPVTTIAAYGFAFYTGTNMISLLIASRFSDAIFWGIVCLIYIYLTTKNLLFILAKITK